ncbi:MAG: glycoside hydrolase family 78 protein [Phycisphaerae bacterium]|nr:glycoside hydrolase family 78 protein [Phycisphaerae bacterium]
MKSIQSMIVIIGLLFLHGCSLSDKGNLSRPGCRPAQLQCEYLSNPLGLDVTQPRLSWQLIPTNTKARGLVQTAYQILVASSQDLLDADRGDLWDSGKVALSQSQQRVYQGQPLKSNMTCLWKVRVWEQNGTLSQWSEPALWTVGLLHQTDWSGVWIGADTLFVRQEGWPPPDNTLPDPWLRKSFRLQGKPIHAMIHVASVGYHELYVNGQRISDQVLSPAVTDHSQRARYVTYDIADALKPGDNVLGLWLGRSWSIFPPYKTNQRPQTPIVKAQTDISLATGQTVRIVTDASWKTHASPNTLLGVWDFMHFGGEQYDARQVCVGWASPGLDDSDWQPATVYEPGLTLSAQQVEPNRKVKAIRPVKIETVAPDGYRIDMGVNFAGWIDMDVTGKPGSTIELSFSEREDQPMTHRLYSRYILDETGQGTIQPRFNYSSCRWVQVSGLTSPPKLSDIRGWMIRTDFDRAADFECNIPLLNKIYDTTLWTFENLSLGGYIVDCPQRERMGYGGDAHATMFTGLNNYSLGAFYTKWAEDWRDVQGKSAAWGTQKKPGELGAGDQAESGNLPYTAPTYWGGGGPAWSGFCVTLPWELYTRYADKRLLSQSFSTIERWLAFLETKAKDDMLVRWGGEWDFLGDWLWPGAQGVNGDTRETLFFNNCYWIYNLQTAGRIAEVLGKTDQARQWNRRANRVREAVHRTFYNAEDHSYVNGFQVYLAMALCTSVPPANLRGPVWQRLEQEILINRQGHIHAGITGGAFVFKALMDHHRNDLIYSMVSQPDYPGWGDMINQGATTIWEDWEGQKSLLHSSYLYVGAWFIHGLAGIQADPDAPGFQQFVIRPGILPDSPLKTVKAHYDSPYGRIESHWTVTRDEITLNVTIPPNTTATIYLPATAPSSVTEGGKSLSSVPGLTVLKTRDGCVPVRAQSGRYRFNVSL